MQIKTKPKAKPIPVKDQAKPRVISENERRAALALRVSRLHHTYSMAHIIGVYPA